MRRISNWLAISRSTLHAQGLLEVLDDSQALPAAGRRWRIPDPAVSLSPTRSFFRLCRRPPMTRQIKKIY